MAAVREDVLVQVRKRVVGFAASRAPRDVAEDVAQESLLLLTTKYPDLVEPADLVPVALRIARFKLMNHWRKARRTRLVTADQPGQDLDALPDREDAEEGIARRLLFERLLEAIDRLGDRCRRLLRLKLEGRAFEEIRRQMSAASINTVYTWDNRCRQQLRAELLPSWGTRVPE